MDEKIKKCPICQYDQGVGIERDMNFDALWIKCGRCAIYKASRMFVQFRNEIKGDSHLLSGLSRELFELKRDPPFFTSENLEEYLRNSLIPDENDIEEKATKLMQRLREGTTFFGEKLKLDATKDYSLAYAKNEDEFRALFAFLNEKKLVNAGTDSREYPGGTITVFLKADGWEFTNRLSGANQDSEQGFVAIWFDRSTQKNLFAIKEAIDEAGYKPICIEDEIFSDKIFDKALTEIRKSRFVVVDLTGSRGSVFFEAGFAYGLGVEIIYVYQKSASKKDTLPLEFYARHHQCYKYENTSDLKEKVKNAIGARIKLRKN